MRGHHSNGSSIRELRRLLGLTQDEVAVRAGCDVKTIRKAERGQRLDIATLRGIAKVFQTPVSSLVSVDSATQAGQSVLVSAWTRAFNRQDVDALVELYSEDAILHFPALKGPVGAEVFRARTDLRQHFETTFAKFDFRKILLNKCRLYRAGDFVLLRLTLAGTPRKSRLMLKWEGMHEFRFANQLIVEHLQFFDA